MGDTEARDIGPTDRMGSSEARQFLSRLSSALGSGGVLVARKRSHGSEGADVTPVDGLEWPKCECGSPRCPDYQARPGAVGDALRSEVAGANERSVGASRKPADGHSTKRQAAG